MTRWALASRWSPAGPQEVVEGAPPKVLLFPGGCPGAEHRVSGGGRARAAIQIGMHAGTLLFPSRPPSTFALLCLWIFHLCQAWWLTPVVLARGRLRKEGCQEVEASLGYLVSFRPAWAT